jgi:hypothetical protein
MLADRLRNAVELYPCDLLFVHRDVEGASIDDRCAEISAAAKALAIPWVPVTPIRMTEAWLLLDETALRRAAGRPRGNEALTLPPLQILESLPDPKQTLFEAIRRASGLSGRRLDKLRPEQVLHQLAGIIDDYSSLRQLSAFRALEAATRTALGRVVAT